MQTGSTMQALQNRAVNVTEPTYERTWEEIHELLDRMSREMRLQRNKFELRRLEFGDVPETHRALMKFVRARAMAECLQWTLGMREHVDDPHPDAIPQFRKD